MNDTSAGDFAANHPRLVYGCMRIAGDLSPAARSAGKRAVQSAVEAGFTHFDHADIYGRGACESLFGEMLSENPGIRQSLTLIGKCGIRFAADPSPGDPKRYDFSARHLEHAVEGSLRRLGTDYLDVLLLHRPDFLMNADVVAGVFERLRASGKVRHFGTSNFPPSRFALLQASCPMRLVANQVEINLANTTALTDGTLDQCLQLGVVPQAWSPLRGCLTSAGDDTQWHRLQSELAAQAKRYETEPWLVVLAWLMRHPAAIAPIIGSQNPQRIAAAQGATALAYTREDWYRLLEARNGCAVA